MAGGDGVKYCFDASAFIEMEKTYPVEIFATLWEKVEDCIIAGCIEAPGEVLKELSVKDDNIHKFVKKHKEKIIVKNNNELMTKSAEIVANYPKLIDVLSTKPQADPFVIALAKINERKVVTMEKPAYNIKNPKIPDVCKAENVAYIDLLEFFKQEKIIV